jgi:putative transposase
MVWSFVYLAVRKVLALIVLVGRSDRSKELEILVLRHELAVLRRRSGRPGFEPPDRALLAAMSQALPRRVWAAFSVRPETLLRWHRQLVARRWTYPHRKPGRPPLARPRRELILRLARENPHWGYQRIAGELKRLGLAVSPTTVRKVLSFAGVPPASERARQSWRSFLRQQAASTLVYAPYGLDARIHRFVYRCTGNPYLISALERYLNLSLRIWYRVIDRLPHLEGSVYGHRDLLTAIRDGDAERAREVAAAHVETFEREIRTVL